jgi:hypothetical protein
LELVRAEIANERTRRRYFVVSAFVRRAHP